MQEVITSSRVTDETSSIATIRKLPRYLFAVALLTVLVVVSSGALDLKVLLGLSAATTRNTPHIRYDETGVEEGFLMDLARLDPNRQKHEAPQKGPARKFVEKYCNLQGMSMDEWYPKDNNDKQRRAPHFMLIGAKKSGTTSLSFDLAQHPDIGGAKRKELLFFLPQSFRRKFVRNGKVLVKKAREEMNNNFNFNWLDTNRDETRNMRMAFDGTPGYIFHSSLSRQFVMCTCPWVKLLVILRDPVDRLWSHYNFFRQHRSQAAVEDWISNDLAQLRRFGLVAKEDRPPSDAMKKTTTSTSLSALEDAVDNAWSNYTLGTVGAKSGATGEGSLGRGIYTIQIRHWLNALADVNRDPMENFLIVRTQDMARNPQAVFDRIVSWLGLPPYQLEEFKERMKTNYTKHGKTVLHEETRRQLQVFYTPFNLQLSQLLQDEQWGNAWDYSQNHKKKNDESPDVNEPILSWPPATT